MTDFTRLKKKAAEFEAKRQYDRAVAIYEQIISETSGSEPREADVPIFNRSGDIYLRLGNIDRAVILYERAVDLYAELGFFNNAIALCNKILRNAPNRASVYYKLGKISAKKGFNSDAKQNFLEYAGRMQRMGKLDEAFRALKEFAELCPGQDDIRLMLAEQLNRVGRKTEAVEQLQMLHEQLEAEGRGAEAAAAVERMLAIDPHAQPRHASNVSRRDSGELVFLDLDEKGSPLVAAPEPLEGLEPISLTEAAALARPLTPQEFAAVPLPPPAEESALQRAEVGGEAAADLPLMPDLPAEPPRWEEPAADAPAPTPPIARKPAPTPAPRAAAAPEIQKPAAEPPATLKSRAKLTPAAVRAQAGASPTPASAKTAKTRGKTPAAGTKAPPASAKTQAAGAKTSQASAKTASTAETPRAAPPKPPVESADELIDFGEMLRQEDQPRSTRMVADAEIPPEGEQADFAEMLQKFKQGIAANMDDEDYASHYDLGIAFKEMGLLDEAIAEFQKALRGPDHRVATYEALGQCFLQKEQYEVAINLMQRALREPGFEDDHFLGVLYMLGYACEALGRHPDAVGYYQRVLAVDIRFRDASDRLAAIAQAAR